MELSRVGTGLDSLLAEKWRVWKVSILSPKLLASEQSGSGRGWGWGGWDTTTLGNEVRCLTPVAMKVKERVTTDDFSRAFCLQMAF